VADGGAVGAVSGGTAAPAASDEDENGWGTGTSDPLGTSLNGG
jgi:hypothetical protein